MIQKLLLFLFLSVGWAVGFVSLPLFAQSGIHIQADNILYEEKGGRIEAWGKVLVSWQDVIVRSERVIFFLPELELVVPASVEVSLAGNRVRGKSFYYSFARCEGWVKEAELFYKVSERGELLFRGQAIRYAHGEWRGENLLFTGCHRVLPLYSVRAKEVIILPEERLVIKNLGFYIREQKILEIPVYSLSLRGGQGGFSPDFGYQKGKGYYLQTRYEYLLGEHLLFSAQVELASLRGFSFSTDLSFFFPSWEVRVFRDFSEGREDTVGGYVHFQRGVVSLWGIILENECVTVDGKTVIISRSPQYVLSLQKKEDEGFSWEIHWSEGYFREQDLALWREDLYLGVGWEGDFFGTTAFFWNTALESGNTIPRFGGSIWWRKMITPVLDLRLAYRFLRAEESPFSFDPEEENMVSLEFLWGQEEGTSLHARVEYNLQTAQWDEVVVGLSLGNQEFSLGAEGIYSFPEGQWTDRRYFVRKKIEDCVELEASFWEPEQGFFLSLNLVGLDVGKRRIKNLFEEEEEEFSLFGVERNDLR
ncbi:MAG: hypothetical protein ACUVQZ_06735 [Candidatus Caldatribacteriaceae bacterium]